MTRVPSTAASSESVLHAVYITRNKTWAASTAVASPRS